MVLGAGVLCESDSIISVWGLGASRVFPLHRRGTLKILLLGQIV
jgi:hypothetical protein